LRPPPRWRKFSCRNGEVDSGCGQDAEVIARERAARRRPRRTRPPGRDHRRGLLARRCHAVGRPFYVFCPGSTGSGTSVRCVASQNCPPMTSR
jgi:hypothetical protein